MDMAITTRWTNSINVQKLAYLRRSEEAATPPRYGQNNYQRNQLTFYKTFVPESSPVSRAKRRNMSVVVASISSVVYLR